jgi:hypothetical protein
MSLICPTLITDRYSSAPVKYCFLLSSWSNICWTQVNQRFLDAGKAMWTTLKCPDVWRPCLYMYLSIALSLDIHEGMFYWYTQDSKDGPAFSQVFDLAIAFSWITSLGDY